MSTSPRWVPLALCAALVVQTQARAQEDKLDAGIAGDPSAMEVFVRMTDQVLKTGADYPAFCEKNSRARRGKLRAKILGTLREKSDRSWAKVEKRVAELGDDISDLKRYWIVNGFACNATADACRELAKDPAVAFIYRKPGRNLPTLTTKRPEQIIKQRAVVIRQSERAAETALAELQKAGESQFPKLAKLAPTWNVKKVKADAAWKTGAMGEGVTIALMDSGLLMTPALARALWQNEEEELNGEDDDGNGYVDDRFGYDFLFQTGTSVGDFMGRLTHGSICGGIMAGRPVEVDGELLVTGVAPKARLMVLRGMGFIEGYEYALANGADILSMSYMWVRVPLGNWRGLYRLAHEHLTIAGIVSVGGSGNFGTNAPKGKQICLPKDIPCVISASGLDQNDEMPEFSSQGPCTWSGVKFYDDYPTDAPLMKPDVTAFITGYPCWMRYPSRLSPRWELVHEAGNNIGLVIGPGGNSFSGPHAGGVAALMLSVNPDLPAWRVKDLMEATCRDLGDQGHDIKYGAGLIDALAAVEAARR